MFFFVNTNLFKGENEKLNSQQTVESANAKTTKQTKNN